jgi:hypothetical protein
LVGDFVIPEKVRVACRSSYGRVSGSFSGLSGWHVYVEDREAAARVTPSSLGVPLSVEHRRAFEDVLQSYLYGESCRQMCRYKKGGEVNKHSHSPAVVYKTNKTASVLFFAMATT